MENKVSGREMVRDEGAMVNKWVWHQPRGSQTTSNIPLMSFSDNLFGNVLYVLHTDNGK